MNVKPFSKDLYRKNDKIIKDIIKKYLPLVKDNPNPYDYDFTIKHSYFKGIEVERINCWLDNNKPPFGNTTRLFERKLTHDNNILFIQLSRDLDKCCLFTKRAVDKKDIYYTSYGDKSYGINQGGCFIFNTNLLNMSILDLLAYNR